MSEPLVLSQVTVSERFRLEEADLGLKLLKLLGGDPFCLVDVSLVDRLRVRLCIPKLVELALAVGKRSANVV